MDLKLGIVEKTVDRYATSKLSNFVNAVRLGWNSYSFLFYIGSISALLVGFFGLAGWISVAITILFFYYAGKFHETVEIDKKKSETRSKKRH
jgi:hypothetical protein